MKREEFIGVDGFEEVIGKLKSGSCKGVECEKCPFSYFNSTNRRDCKDNDYNHYGDIEINKKLQQSAIEFENNFIIRTPSVESIKSKLTEAELKYIKNNLEAFDTNGFEVLNGIGRVVDVSKVHILYKYYVDKYNIQGWKQSRYLPNNFPTIEFKVIGRVKDREDIDTIYVIEHDNKTWLIGESGLWWKELVQIKMDSVVFDQETYLYKVYFNADWFAVNFVYTDIKTNITHNIITSPEDFNMEEFNKKIRQFGFELV